MASLNEIIIIGILMLGCIILVIASFKTTSQPSTRKASATNRIFGNIKSSLQSDKLKTVVMIHRHGDRNPISVGSKDPHRDPMEWPEGLGQLTQIGKLRLYYLGQHTRERYKDLLSANVDEAYSRASDVDRCLASAQLVLSGMYQPDEAPDDSPSKWNPILNWQPIPVHTVPRQYDSLLEASGACPRINKELASLEESHQVKNIYKRLRPLLDLIARDLGLEVKEFSQISWYNGDLKAQHEVGKQLPGWYNKSNIKLLEDASIEIFSLFTSSALLKRLQSGPLLAEIYQRLSDSKFVDDENVSHNKTFFEYSTHDTNMVNLMNTLGVWDKKLPQYGCTLYFELYSKYNVETIQTEKQTATATKEDMRYVKLIKFCDVSNYPHELALDCGQTAGQPCSLKQFKTMVDQFQSSDWSKECHISNE